MFQVECHSTFHWLGVGVVEQLVLVLLLLEVVLLQAAEVQLLRGRGLLLLWLLLLWLNVGHEYRYCWGC